MSSDAFTALSTYSIKRVLQPVRATSRSPLYHISPLDISTKTNNTSIDKIEISMQ